MIDINMLIRFKILLLCFTASSMSHLSSFINYAFYASLYFWPYHARYSRRAYIGFAGFTYSYDIEAW